VAEVFPPGGRAGIEHPGGLPTATTLLGGKMSEDRFHGSFQPHENLRTLLRSHADDMPGVGLDRFSIGTARIGEQVHGADSRGSGQAYPRSATATE